MGGAQPLAAAMCGAAFIGVEVDPARAQRRLAQGYLDVVAPSLDEALQEAQRAMESGHGRSIGVVGNAADVLPELVRRGIQPDLVTDQTAAHDPLNGYIPAGLTLEAAAELRARDPAEYQKRSLSSMGRHVEAMLELRRRGSHVFDYGNNLRAFAQEGGVRDAFAYPGFVPAYIRPLFCQGQGPFRWVALSGDPQDIFTTDRAILDAFPEKAHLRRWLTMAQKRVKFQGLPARICWLGYGERAKAGLVFNDLVASGKVKAPIVIGRDHLDCGSVASPNRETEAMRDGSDAIADWPILNALVNAVNGASWVSFHHGGGVGIGYSLHAGQGVVAGGAPAAAGGAPPGRASGPGDRAREHAQRLAGATYAQIAQAGGGIRSTVEATRAASDDQLLAGARERLARLVRSGVTTVEVKTGYGLSVHQELRLLRIARAAGRRAGCEVLPTLLALHAVPPDSDRIDWLRAVVQELIPEAAREGARGCDAFLEKGAFDADECRTALEAGGQAGVGCPPPAGQLAASGGGHPPPAPEMPRPRPPPRGPP